MGGTSSKPQGGNAETKPTESKTHTSRTPQNENKEDAKAIVLAHPTSNAFIETLRMYIHLPPPLPMLVIEYAFLYECFLSLVTSRPATIPRWHFFQPEPSHMTDAKAAEKIARELVWTAAPLDELEKAIRENPKVLLPQCGLIMELDGMKVPIVGTLLQLALILLDNTITSENSRTDEGQAERILNLTRELLPDNVTIALEQARLAAPLMDEKAEKAEEAARSTALDAAFEEIKQNNFDAARQIINDYIKSIKPPVITDNRFFLNLLKMVPEAFDVLTNNVGKLHKGWAGWWENQADQYCYVTVGTVNRKFPHKLRKALLDPGLYNLLQGNAPLTRNFDASDAAFIGTAGSVNEVGVSSFYCGAEWRAERASWVQGRPAVVFFKLISAITSAQQNLCCEQAGIAEEHRDFVESVKRP